MNTSRGAPFTDSGSRAPRDEARDRAAVRTGSPPRRSGRVPLGPEPGPDEIARSRDEPPRRSGRVPLGPEPGPDDIGRPPFHDSRHPARDNRGDGYQAPIPRGPERDDRGNVDSTREAFFGRGSEGDHGRSRQDDSYGRLNPIQSVLNDGPTVPSGPRGRGAPRGGRGNGNINTPPPRFPHGDHAGGGPDDRYTPTGPGGRGRQHYPSGPMATPPQHDRPRSTPTGPSGTPNNGNPGSGDTPSVGVHPSRLAQINGPGPSPGNAPRTQTQAPPRPTQRGNTPEHVSRHDNREQPASHPPPDQNMAPPSGPGGPDRRKVRDNRQLQGINSILNAQQLAGSDARVLTGGSSASTPSQERPDPVGAVGRTPTNGNEEHTRGERERGHRDRAGERSGRSSRRHTPDRARERDRSPTRDREGKDRSEHRDRERRSDGSQRRSGGRDDRDREARHPGRDAPVSIPRDSRPGGIQASSNSEPLGSRETRPRHHERGDGAPGGRGEEWRGGSMRGRPSRSGDHRLEPHHRDERSRKRQSDDASGFVPDKRPRH